MRAQWPVQPLLLPLLEQLRYSKEDKALQVGEAHWTPFDSRCLLRERMQTKSLLQGTFQVVSPHQSFVSRDNWQHDFKGAVPFKAPIANIEMLTWEAIKFVLLI
jgi:hypothetical protein